MEKEEVKKAEETKKVQFYVDLIVGLNPEKLDNPDDLEDEFLERLVQSLWDLPCDKAIIISSRKATKKEVEDWLEQPDWENI